MKMNFKSVSFWCERNGICVYERQDEKDRRKRYYRLLIPVFENGKIEPVKNTEYCVSTIKECYQYVTKLLEDDRFRANVAQWVRTW